MMIEGGGKCKDIGKNIFGAAVLSIQSLNGNHIAIRMVKSVGDGPFPLLIGVADEFYMKAKISTRIQANENEMWKELQKVSSLMHVASPILKFKPKGSYTISENWELGREYKFKLYFFGIISFGDHAIRLAEINPIKKLIITNESGNLVKVWNHTIIISPNDEESIKYLDEIEIEAGVLTIPLWLFAHVFYRHRQRKWKKTLSR